MASSGNIPTIDCSAASHEAASGEPERDEDDAPAAARARFVRSLLLCCRAPDCVLDVSRACRGAVSACRGAVSACRRALNDRAARAVLQHVHASALCDIVEHRMPQLREQWTRLALRRAVAAGDVRTIQCAIALLFGESRDDVVLCFASWFLCRVVFAALKPQRLSLATATVLVSLAWSSLARSDPLRVRSEGDGGRAR